MCKNEKYRESKIFLLFSEKSQQTAQMLKTEIKKSIIFINFIIYK